MLKLIILPQAKRESQTLAFVCLMSGYIVLYWDVCIKLAIKQQIENIEWNKKNKIRYADATKCIPLQENSVEAIYTSHMLEHLSREGAKSFLYEAKKVLKTDGVLRVSIPDLKIYLEKYSINEDADEFMTGIMVEAPSINTLKQKIFLFLNGYRHHQWMYDGKSLSKLFIEAGFRNIKICAEGETTIENSTGLDLFERGKNSVYVEGKK